MNMADPIMNHQISLDSDAVQKKPSLDLHLLIC